MSHVVSYLRIMTSRILGKLSGLIIPHGGLVDARGWIDACSGGPHIQDLLMHRLEAVYGVRWALLGDDRLHAEIPADA
jgi:hypothetical protein